MKINLKGKSTIVLFISIELTLFISSSITSMLLAPVMIPWMRTTGLYPMHSLIRRQRMTKISLGVIFEKLWFKIILINLWPLGSFTGDLDRPSKVLKIILESNLSFDA